MTQRIITAVAIGVPGLSIMLLELSWWIESAAVGAVIFGFLLWQSRDILSWRGGLGAVALGLLALGASAWISQSRDLTFDEIASADGLGRFDRRLPFWAGTLLTLGALTLAGSAVVAVRRKRSQGPTSVV